MLQGLFQIQVQALLLLLLLQQTKLILKYLGK